MLKYLLYYFILYIALIILTLVNTTNQQWDNQDYGNISTESYISTYYWGTYKPNLYFSMKNKIEKSENFGILWYKTNLNNNKQYEGISNLLRHDCNLEDDLTYYWTIHDGKKFGNQEIIDKKNNVKLETTFIKTDYVSLDQQSWYAVIKGSEITNQEKKQYHSLILYYSLENFKVEDKAVINIENEEFIINNYNNSDNSDYIEISLKHTSENNIKKYPSYIKYYIQKSDVVDISYQKYRKKYEDTWRIKSFISNELNQQEEILSKDKASNYTRFSKVNNINSPNITAFQIILKSNYNVYIKYTNSFEEVKKVFSKEDLFDKISKSVKLFNSNFSKYFKIDFSTLNDVVNNERDKNEIISMSKQALSSIFGGIGYYYGKISISLTEKEKKIIESGRYIPGFRYTLDNYGLLSASPSRSFFPRGFLWDEGFHNIIISKYNLELSVNIINSWLSTMSATGYIAREQIRGAEQIAKSDNRFILQDKLIANPPTFIFPINSIINYYKYYFEQKDLKYVENFLRKVFDKFSLWYEWFEYNQKSIGSIDNKKNISDNLDYDYNLDKNEMFKDEKLKSNFYSWQGRNAEHNLACGLDDFPRALTTNLFEKHLDLHIWIIELLKCLNNLAELFDYEDKSYFKTKITKMTEDLFKLKDPNLRILNDFLGPQVDLIKTSKYKREVFPVDWRGDNKCGYVYPKNSRKYTGNENPIGNDFTNCNPYSNNMCCSSHGWCGSGPDFCDCKYCKKAVKFEEGYNLSYKNKKEIFNPHIGYTTLFPLMFGLLDTNNNSEEFNNLLYFLESEDELNSKYGIRSLSKSDLLYHTGDDYWRGNLWINMNYMTLRGLYKYYKDNNRAFKIYNTLRSNIIKTVFNEWKSTKMFYENYSDITGNGLKARPFTGWTALIINIISEEYDSEII